MVQRAPKKLVHLNPANLPNLTPTQWRKQFVLSTLLDDLIRIWHLVSMWSCSLYNFGFSVPKPLGQRSQYHQTLLPGRYVQGYLLQAELRENADHATATALTTSPRVFSTSPYILVARALSARSGRMP